MLKSYNYFLNGAEPALEADHHSTQIHGAAVPQYIFNCCRQAWTCHTCNKNQCFDRLSFCYLDLWLKVSQIKAPTYTQKLIFNLMNIHVCSKRGVYLNYAWTWVCGPSPETPTHFNPKKTGLFWRLERLGGGGGAPWWPPLRSWPWIARLPQTFAQW